MIEASTTTALLDGWKKADWLPSVVNDELLKKFSRVGLIPVWDLNNWRAPMDELVPAPIEEEQVLHTPFINQGLSLPLHDFMRALLLSYDLQLHHLNPNSILHIACFMTLC